MRFNAIILFKVGKWINQIFLQYPTSFEHLTLFRILWCINAKFCIYLLFLWLKGPFNTCFRYHVINYLLFTNASGLQVMWISFKRNRQLNCHLVFGHGSGWTNLWKCTKNIDLFSETTEMPVLPNNLWATFPNKNWLFKFSSNRGFKDGHLGLEFASESRRLRLAYSSRFSCVARLCNEATSLVNSVCDDRHTWLHFGRGWQLQRTKAAILFRKSVCLTPDDGNIVSRGWRSCNGFLYQ